MMLPSAEMLSGVGGVGEVDAHALQSWLSLLDAEIQLKEQEKLAKEREYVESQARIEKVMEDAALRLAKSTSIVEKLQAQESKSALEVELLQQEMKKSRELAETLHQLVLAIEHKQALEHDMSESSEVAELFARLSSMVEEERKAVAEYQALSAEYRTVAGSVQAQMPIPGPLQIPAPGLSPVPGDRSTTPVHLVPGAGRRASREGVPAPIVYVPVSCAWFEIVLSDLRRRNVETSRLHLRLTVSPADRISLHIRNMPIDTSAGIKNLFNTLDVDNAHRDELLNYLDDCGFLRSNIEIVEATASLAT